MSDLSDVCVHGVSRAKPCGDCMGDGIQNFIDAINDPATPLGVKTGYELLLDKLSASQAREAELQRKYETTLLMVKDLSLQCAELRKLLEESKVPEDTVRLDFISKSGVDWDGLSGYFFHYGSHSGETLRDCIDAAMLAAAPQPKDQS